MLQIVVGQPFTVQWGDGRAAGAARNQPSPTAAGSIHALGQDMYELEHAPYIYLGFHTYLLYICTTPNYVANEAKP